MLDPAELTGNTRVTYPVILALLYGSTPAPNLAEARTLFERGVQQMNIGALELALETFTSVITIRPDFAEGWNKRATLYFLTGDLAKSLNDCDEVLRRNPSHFGALAGYGQIYIQLEQPERALDYFQRALRINPNMQGVAQSIEVLKQIVGRRRDRVI